MRIRDNSVERARKAKLFARAAECLRTLGWQWLVACPSGRSKSRWVVA
jgi:hypothetical protein